MKARIEEINSNHLKVVIGDYEQEFRRDNEQLPFDDRMITYLGRGEGATDYAKMDAVLVKSKKALVDQGYPVAA